MKWLHKKQEDKKTLKKAVSESEKTPRTFRAVAARYFIAPIISEKATALSTQGQYMFEVSENANKVEIKKAIMELYHVDPVRVNIENIRGKRVSRGRIQGKRKDWKRAIVTLKKGQSIDVYEGV